MNNVMSARQAANEYFNGTVSYWKLLEMVKARQIPYVKVGGRIFFRRTTLDEWMEQLEQNPPENRAEPEVKRLSKCN